MTRQIAARTGVRDESPQVIVLHNGRPARHASHVQVRVDEIARAMHNAA